MTKFKFSYAVIPGTILFLFAGVALYLRVYLPYEQVFSDGLIRYTGIDAYYHMRLVDNLLSHFPHLLVFDPYTLYPHGQSVWWPPFYDWLLAGTIWCITLGSASQHTVDVIGVYFPAILGTLTIIPVYFIGKELFGRWAGIIAAGLVTLLPSEFLSRSILGFTDHHVAETLFTTLTMLFFLLAIKCATRRQFVLKHLKHWDWAIIGRPLIYSVVAGVFLGIYLLTWAGGLLFVFLTFIYLIIQSIIDHFRKENSEYLIIVGTLSILVAFIVSFPFLPQTRLAAGLFLPSLMATALIPLVLNGLSKLLMRWSIKSVYYPFILIGSGLVGMAVFYVIDPSLFKDMLQRFEIFAPVGSRLTIIEVQPLLFPSGNFDFSIAWFNFTTGFFLSLIALGMLFYLVIKYGTADKTLLLVWSLLILATTLGQRRFGYYYVVNVALLTSYISIIIYFIARFIVGYLAGVKTEHLRRQIIDFAMLRDIELMPTELPEESKRKRIRIKKGAGGATISGLSAAIGVIAVFFLVFYPGIGRAVAIAEQPRFSPDTAWYETLSWVKENTPEPFDNPDAYYELHEPPANRQDYNYPDSAYGIISWWDYGHWITRIAHRIPVCNPFQSGVRRVAEFFSTQDEISANDIMKKLDSRYIIIDKALTISKFHAVATYSRSTKERFYGIYHRRVEGGLEASYLFYPEYYQSMAVRLYNFDGVEVNAENPVVISYEEKINEAGIVYMEITSTKTFFSYEEAQAYVLSQDSQQYKIVGTNPYISPVPLRALKHYKLIYESTGKATVPGNGTISLVKVFEYTE